MNIGNRYIDADRLLEQINLDDLHTANGASLTPWQKVERWLKRQPRVPALVSGQGAAKIIGIPPPHLSRYQDRLNPIQVEGTRWPVYVKSEVEDLAKEIKREKAAKQKAAKS